MRALALILVAFFSTIATAQLRTIPKEAVLGQLRHLEAMVAEIDGKPRSLAQGAQIRDADNRLGLPLSLVHKTQVRYVVDSTGMVHRVWILSEAEKAALPPAPPPWLPPWLERIIGVPSAEAGEGTQWTLSTRWTWPYWLTLLLLIFCVAFVVHFYYRERRSAGRLYVYDGASLSSSPATAIPAIEDLAPVSSLCLARTGTAPSRAHMLLFNATATHAILHFTHRQSLRDGFPREVRHNARILERKQCPRVPHRQLPIMQHLEHDLGEFEEAKRVGNRRPVASDGIGDVLLRQFEFGDQTLVAAGFIDWRQVVALQILDQRECQQRAVVGIALYGRDALPRELLAST